jgi:hypothetical protein
MKASRRRKTSEERGEVLGDKPEEPEAEFAGDLSAVCSKSSDGEGLRIVVVVVVAGGGDGARSSDLPIADVERNKVGSDAVHRMSERCPSSRYSQGQSYGKTS